MSTNPSFYQTLGVSPTASDTEIKAAYRKLARQYHPDVNAGSAEAERKFKAVGEAYATLSDPDKRSAYDAKLGLSRANEPKPGPPPPPQPKAKTQPPPKTEPPKKQTQAPPPKPKAAQAPPPKPQPKPAAEPNVGQQFKGMFDGLFKQGDKPAADAQPKAAPKPKEPSKEPPKSKPQGQAPVRGEDVTVETLITSDEAERGTVKPVSVFHVEPCKRCSATGRVNGVTCPACGGEKQLTQVKKLDVKIPGGVKSGSKIRVAKEGGYGQHGGDPGDLFLLVRVDSDKGLRVEGAHVYSEVFVSLPQAVLGCEVLVQTLHGKVHMSVPPLTPPGTVMRLKGKGASQNPNSPMGDHYVTIQVAMPKSLSPEAKSHYQALLKLDETKPQS